MSTESAPSPEVKAILKHWVTLQEERYGPDWKRLLAAEMTDDAMKVLKPVLDQLSTQAPVPYVPPAKPVPAGDSYYERLAAPLSEEQRRPRPPEGERSQTEPETGAEREARRLAARMPPGYVPLSGADITFDPRIAYELALGLSKPSEVFAKYGVPEERARALIANGVFLTTIKRYKEEVSATGISFRLKAKIQAEDLLTHSYLLASDPEVPAAVRADLIKWTAKVAGYEPTDKDKGGGGAGGAGFQLNITFAGVPAQATVVGGHTVEGEFKRVEG